MECSIIDCKKRAKHTYKLGEVRLNYCDKHKRLPDDIVRKIKRGFYSNISMEKRREIQNASI